MAHHFDAEPEPEPETEETAGMELDLDLDDRSQETGGADSKSVTDEGDEQQEDSDVTMRDAGSDDLLPPEPTEAPEHMHESPADRVYGHSQTQHEQQESDELASLNNPPRVKSVPEDASLSSVLQKESEAEEQADDKQESDADEPMNQASEPEEQDQGVVEKGEDAVARPPRKRKRGDDEDAAESDRDDDDEDANEGNDEQAAEEEGEEAKGDDEDEGDEEESVVPIVDENDGDAEMQTGEEEEESDKKPTKKRKSSSKGKAKVKKVKVKEPKESTAPTAPKAPELRELYGPLPKDSAEPLGFKAAVPELLPMVKFWNGELLTPSDIKRLAKFEAYISLSQIRDPPLGSVTPRDILENLSKDIHDSTSVSNADAATIAKFVTEDDVASWKELTKFMLQFFVFGDYTRADADEQKMDPTVWGSTTNPKGKYLEYEHKLHRKKMCSRWIDVAFLLEAAKVPNFSVITKDHLFPNLSSDEDVRETEPFPEFLNIWYGPKSKDNPRPTYVSSKEKKKSTEAAAAAKRDAKKKAANKGRGDDDGDQDMADAEEEKDDEIEVESLREANDADLDDDDGDRKKKKKKKDENRPRKKVKRTTQEREAAKEAKEAKKREKQEKEKENRVRSITYFNVIDPSRPPEELYSRTNGLGWKIGSGEFIAESKAQLIVLNLVKNPLFWIFRSWCMTGYDAKARNGGHRSQNTDKLKEVVKDKKDKDGGIEAFTTEFDRAPWVDWHRGIFEKPQPTPKAPEGKRSSTKPAASTEAASQVDDRHKERVHWYTRFNWDTGRTGVVGVVGDDKAVVIRHLSELLEDLTVVPKATKKSDEAQKGIRKDPAAVQSGKPIDKGAKSRGKKKDEKKKKKEKKKADESSSDGPTAMEIVEEDSKSSPSFVAPVVLGAEVSDKSIVDETRSQLRELYKEDMSKLQHRLRLQMDTLMQSLDRVYEHDMFDIVGRAVRAKAPKPLQQMIWSATHGFETPFPVDTYRKVQVDWRNSLKWQALFRIAYESQLVFDTTSSGNDKPDEKKQQKLHSTNLFTPSRKLMNMARRSFPLQDAITAMQPPISAERQAEVRVGDVATLRQRMMQKPTDPKELKTTPGPLVDSSTLNDDNKPFISVAETIDSVMRSVVDQLETELTMWNALVKSLCDRIRPNGADRPSTFRNWGVFLRYMSSLAVPLAELLMSEAVLRRRTFVNCSTDVRQEERLYAWHRILESTMSQFHQLLFLEGASTRDKTFDATNLDESAHRFQSGGPKPKPTGAASISDDKKKIDLFYAQCARTLLPAQSILSRLIGEFGLSRAASAVNVAGADREEDISAAREADPAVKACLATALPEFDVRNLLSMGAMARQKANAGPLSLSYLQMLQTLAWPRGAQLVVGANESSAREPHSIFEYDTFRRQVSSLFSPGLGVKQLLGQIDELRKQNDALMTSENERLQIAQGKSDEIEQIHRNIAVRVQPKLIIVLNDLVKIKDVPETWHDFESPDDGSVHSLITRMGHNARLFCTVAENGNNLNQLHRSLKAATIDCVRILIRTMVLLLTLLKLTQTQVALKQLPEDRNGFVARIHPHLKASATPSEDAVAIYECYQANFAQGTDTRKTHFLDMYAFLMLAWTIDLRHVFSDASEQDMLSMELLMGEIGDQVFHHSKSYLFGTLLNEQGALMSVESNIMSSVERRSDAMKTRPATEQTTFTDWFHEMIPTDEELRDAEAWDWRSATDMLSEFERAYPPEANQVETLRIRMNAATSLCRLLCAMLTNRTWPVRSAEWLGAVHGQSADASRSLDETIKFHRFKAAGRVTKFSSTADATIACKFSKSEWHSAMIARENRRKWYKGSDVRYAHAPEPTPPASQSLHSGMYLDGDGHPNFAYETRFGDPAVLLMEPQTPTRAKELLGFVFVVNSFLQTSNSDVSSVSQLSSLLRQSMGPAMKRLARVGGNAAEEEAEEQRLRSLLLEAVDPHETLREMMTTERKPEGSPRLNDTDAYELKATDFGALDFHYATDSRRLARLLRDIHERRPGVEAVVNPPESGGTAGGVAPMDLGRDEAGGPPPPPPKSPARGSGGPPPPGKPKTPVRGSGAFGFTGSPRKPKTKTDTGPESMDLTDDEVTAVEQKLDVVYRGGEQLLRRPISSASDNVTTTYGCSLWYPRSTNTFNPTIDTPLPSVWSVDQFCNPPLPRSFASSVTDRDAAYRPLRQTVDARLSDVKAQDMLYRPLDAFARSVSGSSRLEIRNTVLFDSKESNDRSKPRLVDIIGWLGSNKKFEKEQDFTTILENPIATEAMMQRPNGQLCQLQVQLLRQSTSDNTELASQQRKIVLKSAGLWDSSTQTIKFNDKSGNIQLKAGTILCTVGGILRKRCFTDAAHLIDLSLEQAAIMRSTDSKSSTRVSGGIVAEALEQDARAIPLSAFESLDLSPLRAQLNKFVWKRKTSFNSIKNSAGENKTGLGHKLKSTYELFAIDRPVGKEMRPYKIEHPKWTGTPGAAKLDVDNFAHFLSNLNCAEVARNIIAQHATQGQEVEKRQDLMTQIAMFAYNRIFTAVISTTREQLQLSLNRHGEADGAVRKIASQAIVNYKREEAPGIGWKSAIINRMRGGVGCLFNFARTAAPNSTNCELVLIAPGALAADPNDPLNMLNQTDAGGIVRCPDLAIRLTRDVFVDGTTPLVLAPISPLIGAFQLCAEWPKDSPGRGSSSSSSNETNTGGHTCFLRANRSIQVGESWCVPMFAEDEKKKARVTMYAAANQNMDMLLAAASSTSGATITASKGSTATLQEVFGNILSDKSSQSALGDRLFNPNDNAQKARLETRELTMFPDVDPRILFFLRYASNADQAFSSEWSEPTAPQRWMPSDVYMLADLVTLIRTKSPARPLNDLHYKYTGGLDRLDVRFAVRNRMSANVDAILDTNMFAIFTRVPQTAFHTPDTVFVTCFAACAIDTDKPIGLYVLNAPQTAVSVQEVSTFREKCIKAFHHQRVIRHEDFAAKVLTNDGDLGSLLQDIDLEMTTFRLFQQKKLADAAAPKQREISTPKKNKSDRGDSKDAS